MTTDGLGTDTAASFTRDEAAVITSVDDSITDVLGWSAAQLVGRPSTEFIHPEDQPSAVAAWFAMLSAPGEPRVWRGRYQTAAGAWQWVETVNVNRLDDVDAPFVFSTMTRISVDQVSVEEELRARKQLLSRLADALPVGLFQLDADRMITFTNDRFHAIVGCASAATVTAQFATVAPGDREELDALITAVLTGEPVDDIDIHLLVPTEESRAAMLERVCVVAMRPLTDSTGQVSGAIGCVSDVTERALLRHELEIRASVDPLTSCLNRGTTLDLLTRTLAEQSERAAPTAIMFVDLDSFKEINDELGHAAGDVVLEVAARRMTGALRPGDELGRLGGDEFLVICPNVESRAVGLTIGTRLARTLTTDIEIGEGTVALRASVGVAWTSDLVDADTLVAQADAAMYEAKCTRESAAVLYAPTPARSTARRGRPAAATRE